MAVPSRVVDFSAWIEWLIGSALGKNLGRLCLLEICTANTS